MEPLGIAGNQAREIVGELRTEGLERIGGRPTGKMEGEQLARGLAERVPTERFTSVEASELEIGREHLRRSSVEAEDATIIVARELVQPKVVEVVQPLGRLIDRLD